MAASDMKQSLVWYLDKGGDRGRLQKLHFVGDFALHLC